MLAEQLEFKVTSEWEKFARESSWAVFIPELAKDENGQEYLRKRGSSLVYKANGDGYLCASCNSEIQEANVAHPIWDGPFPMSGSGNVHIEPVPYCPKCEQRPKLNGSPIQKLSLL